MSSWRLKPGYTSLTLADGRRLPAGAVVGDAEVAESSDFFFDRIEEVPAPEAPGAISAFVAPPAQNPTE